MITNEELEQDRIKLKNKTLLVTGITVGIVALLALIFQSSEVLFFGIIPILLFPALFTGKQKREYILKF